MKYLEFWHKGVLYLFYLGTLWSVHWRDKNRISFIFLSLLLLLLECNLYLTSDMRAVYWYSVTISLLDGKFRPLGRKHLKVDI